MIGNAEEKGVPVMIIQSDTLLTIDRAEDIVRRGRTRSAGTIEQMGELVADHADSDAIVGINQ